MVNRKILIAANTDYRFDQRLQRISSSLREAGYQLELLGRQFNGTPEKFGAAIHLPLWFRKGKLAYLELNIRFFFFLIGKKTDAICSVDLDTLPACWLAARLKACILIQDSHEYMAEVPEVAFRPRTKKVWHQLAAMLLPACHLRYTVSQSLVEEFVRMYGQRFELIRNMAELQPSVEPQEDFPGLPEKDYLVFLGAVNRGRGLEELLEVLTERDEILVIIGEGDLSSEIRQLVKQLGLSKRVFFSGKILPEKARTILRNARAGINLLRDEGLSYRYSLANKFFDYVHAGIPQVCIDFPEYRKLMEEFRVGLLTSLEKEKIRVCLDQLKDSAVRKQLSSEAVKAKELWNWQQESLHLQALYQELFERFYHTKAISK
jgi:glycosyltransferase involved in cell wall biosynthesis